MSGVSLGVSGLRVRAANSDQSDTDNSDLEVDIRHSSSPYKDSGYRWVIMPSTSGQWLLLYFSVILMDLWRRKRSIVMTFCPPWPLIIGRF